VILFQLKQEYFYL